MSFRITCPECSAQFPIAAGLLDDDGKRLAAITGEMEPPLARAALSYLRFFKPAKTSLRTSRAIAILQELQELVRAGTVCKDERGGVRRPATFRTWIAGIEHMHQIDGRLTLPLVNHNYLRSVVFGIADSEDSKAEQARDKSIRHARSAESTPVDETLLALRTQLDRGFITLEEYDRKVAERRALVAGALGSLKSIPSKAVK